MEYSFPLYILLTGSIIVIANFSCFGLEKLGTPVLIGYFILGFAVQLLNLKWPFMQATGYQILEFLANIGVIVLLFRVGLESQLGEWAVSPRLFADLVLISGAMAFLVSLSLRPLLKKESSHSY